MNSTIHNGRITGPVSFVTPGGAEETIPLGPCLVEQLDGRSVDIIWGARGQLSAALAAADVEAAQSRGDLVLLD